MQISATELRKQRPLAERLRTVADMIQLGERIPYGSDSELLREAAAELEAAKLALDSLQRAIEAEGYWVMVNVTDATRTIERKPEDH